MNNILLATRTADALITVALNAIRGVQEYNALVAKARAEGRDISDAELATLRAQSEHLTDEVLKKLRG